MGHLIGRSLRLPRYVDHSFWRYALMAPSPAGVWNIWEAVQMALYLDVLQLQALSEVLALPHTPLGSRVQDPSSRFLWFSASQYLCSLSLLSKGRKSHSLACFKGIKQNLLNGLTHLETTSPENILFPTFWHIAFLP